MKVKELIELLRKEDPELRVVMDGYEGGQDDVTKLEKIRLMINFHKAWYYGTHHEFEKDDGYYEKDFKGEIEDAVNIPR